MRRAACQMVKNDDEHAADGTDAGADRHPGARGRLHSGR